LPHKDLRQGFFEPFSVLPGVEPLSEPLFYLGWFFCKIKSPPVAFCALGSDGGVLGRLNLDVACMGSQATEGGKVSEFAEFLKNNPVAVIVTVAVGFVAGVATLIMFFRKDKPQPPPRRPQHMKCARCGGKGRYSDYEGTSIANYCPQQTCEVCAGKGYVEL